MSITDIIAHLATQNHHSADPSIIRATPEISYSLCNLYVTLQVYSLQVTMELYFPDGAPSTIAEILWTKLC
ncbi:hypothetical protein KP509_20G054000 [Ceratopteris richardii]|uniref:Uncharacterized protein n=1 Tax=Ceratopteris richardii TaxID=49495 RepID=A0A8T2SG51_CERRI|nr:hypothetical protein KP509_20G054000 [Ceratopteris richardii]